MSSPLELGDELSTAGAGELAFALRGVPHALANRSNALARVVIVCTPVAIHSRTHRRSCRTHERPSRSGRFTTMSQT
ncbi:MAG: hypothetical protein M3P15_08935 [Actinomycetota bacterium]|nr:hypothetical protein [Actinomycetota bacterium]